MSISSLITQKNVASVLKHLRLKLLRNVDSPVLTEPRTKNYSLVGTAFDYLLRFEIKRRAPHAVARYSRRFCCVSDRC